MHEGPTAGTYRPSRPAALYDPRADSDRIRVVAGAALPSSDYQTNSPTPNRPQRSRQSWKHSRPSGKEGVEEVQGGPEAGLLRGMAQHTLPEQPAVEGSPRPRFNVRLDGTPGGWKDEPEFLLQPETRPISHDQLVIEVKGIYAGLVMVEVKCIDIDEKQSAAVQGKDRLTRGSLRNDQWQALMALHKQLLHEHHDFFLASQHPSASPALSTLAAKYSMPARMWRHGIHAFLEVLRPRTSTIPFAFLVSPKFYRFCNAIDAIYKGGWFNKYHAGIALGVNDRGGHAAIANIVALLNEMLECGAVPSGVSLRPTEDTTFKKSDRPLPEDFAMRGQLFIHGDFPRTWFTDVTIDDDECTVDLASMAQSRIERILWLAFRISTLPGYHHLVKDITTTLPSRDDLRARSKRRRNGHRRLLSAVNTLDDQDQLKIQEPMMMNTLFSKASTPWDLHQEMMLDSSINPQGRKLASSWSPFLTLSHWCHSISRKCTRLRKQLNLCTAGLRVSQVLAYSMFIWPAKARTIPKNSQSTEIASNLAIVASSLTSLPYVAFLAAVLSVAFYMAALKDPISVWGTMMSIWAFGWWVIKADPNTTLWDCGT